MKKNIKLISLLVTAILLVGAVVGISVSAAETDETPGVRIAGQNLAYESAVQVLYLVETKNATGYTPKLILSDKTVTVTDAIPEGVTVKECPKDENGEYLTVTANGKTYFAFFSDGIYPKDMRVAIYATPVLVSDADGSVVAGKESVYSPWQYSINRFDKQPTAAQTALYTSMLDYAGALQDSLMTPAEIEAAGGYADAYLRYEKIYKAASVKTVVGDSGWIRSATPTPFVADKTYNGKLFYKFEVADVENIIGNVYEPKNLKPGTNSIVVHYVGTQTVEYTSFDMEKTLADYNNIIKGSNANIVAGPFDMAGNGYYDIISETTADGETNQYLETGRGKGGSEVYACIPAFPRNYKRHLNEYVSYSVEFDLKVVDIARWGTDTKPEDGWPIRIYVGATSASNDVAPATIILYPTYDSEMNVTSLKYGSGSGPVVFNLTKNGEVNSSEWIHLAITIDPETRTSTIKIGDKVFEKQNPAKTAAQFDGFDYLKVGVRGTMTRYEYIKLGVDNVKSSAEAISLRGEYNEETTYTCDEDSAPSKSTPGTDGKGYSESRDFDGDYAWAVGHDKNGTSSVQARSASFAGDDNCSDYETVDYFWASFDFMYCGGKYSNTKPNGNYTFQLFLQNARGKELINITCEPTANMEGVIFGGVTFDKDVWYHIVIEADNDYDQLIVKKGVDMIVNGVRYTNVGINNGNLKTNYDGSFGYLHVGTRAYAEAAAFAVDNVTVGVEGTLSDGKLAGVGKYNNLAEKYDNLETLASGTAPIYSVSGSSMHLNDGEGAFQYAKLTDMANAGNAANKVLEIGKNSGAAWSYVRLGNYNKPTENAMGETHVFETDFMYTEFAPGNIAKGHYVYALKFADSTGTNLFELEFVRPNNTDCALYLETNAADSHVSKYELNPGAWYNIRVEAVEVLATDKDVAHLLVKVYVNNSLVYEGKKTSGYDIAITSVQSEVRGGASGTNPYTESFKCYWDNTYIATIAP